MRILSKIKRWYLGGPLPIKEENNGAITTRLPNTFEPSFSARIVRSFIGFYLRNWQWFLGTIVFIVVTFITSH